MEWVHCNKMCGKALMFDRCVFYFTACGHIVCDTCHGKAQDSKCPVCGKTTRFVKLDDLPKEVRDSYFTDSDQALRHFGQGVLQTFDEAIKVADFQAAQDRYYTKAVNKMLSEMHMKMTKMQVQLQAKDEEMKSMQNLMNQLRLDMDSDRQQQERESHGHQAGVGRSRGAQDGAPVVNKRMNPQQEPGFTHTQATNRNGGNMVHTQATERTHMNRNVLPQRGAAGFPNTQATSRNATNMAQQTQNTQRTRVNQDALRQHQGQRNTDVFAVPNAPSNRLPERMYRPLDNAAPVDQGHSTSNSTGLAAGRLVSGTSAGGPSAANPNSFRNPSLLSRFGNQGLASTTNRISLPHSLANRPSSVNSSNMVSPASSIGRQTISFLGMSPSSTANVNTMQHGLRRF